MSKWTETRDAVGDGAVKAWESANPETRSFVAGIFTGICLSFALVGIVWALF